MLGLLVVHADQTATQEVLGTMQTTAQSMRGPRTEYDQRCKICKVFHIPPSTGAAPRSLRALHASHCIVAARGEEDAGRFSFLVSPGLAASAALTTSRALGRPATSPWQLQS